MKQKECVVIGAGLAGLAAAYRLMQANWKVTVLEAKERLGGRVMTHHFESAPELNCELGGEWIGSDHLEMQRLCCAFDLELQQHRYANSFWSQTKRAQQGFVFDHQVVVVSSMNWSGEGVLSNRDAGVIIENATAAAYYENIFLDDWTNHSTQKMVSDRAA
jgi:monoamine oxidase